MIFEWTDSDYFSGCTATMDDKIITASTYEYEVVKDKQAYGYKINVDGIDYVCNSCFFFEPHLFHAVAEASMMKAAEGITGDDLFIK